MFKFIHAKQASDIVEPGTTLGIEITDRDIAKRCGPGNIDGQHGMDVPDFWDDMPRQWRGRAAIDLATDPPFVTLPADGTTFATSRPDVDSIGAMAILVLRSLGLENSIDRELVATIAKADSFRPGGDWQPRPLPTEENPWPSGANSVDGTKGIAHLGTICSPRRGDVGEGMSLADRVFVMAWALTERSVAYIDRSQLLDRWTLMEPIAKACGSTSSIDADQVLGQAHDRVLGSRRALAKAAHEPGAVRKYHIDCGATLQGGSPGCECEGGPVLPDIAIVRVAHAGALGLGYCVAPVVIAFDQAVRGKVTIAAYDVRYLDVPALKARLNELEPGWGGGVAIIGSPQNVGTKLSDDVIVSTVSEFIRR